MKKLFLSLLHKTNRLHVAVRLFSNRSQKRSKCGKNINYTLGYHLVCHFLILITFHFDVICDLLLNRHTAHGTRHTADATFTALESKVWFKTSAECEGKLLILYHKTNKEAPTVLCFPMFNVNLLLNTGNH